MATETPFPMTGPCRLVRIPGGLVHYHQSGSMQVQIFARDAQAQWQHIGYMGRFSVREAHVDGSAVVGVVDHIMELAYPAELLDEGPERPFALEQDRLTLGDGRTAYRHFERIG